MQASRMSFACRLIAACYLILLAWLLHSGFAAAVQQEAMNVFVALYDVGFHIIMLATIDGAHRQLARPNAGTQVCAGRARASMHARPADQLDADSIFT